MYIIIFKIKQNIGNKIAIGLVSPKPYLTLITSAQARIEISKQTWFNTILKNFFPQVSEDKYYLNAIDELQVAQVSDSNEGLKQGKENK